jgi:hypothetical protein
LTWRLARRKRQAEKGFRARMLPNMSAKSLSGSEVSLQGSWSILARVEQPEPRDVLVEDWHSLGSLGAPGQKRAELEYHKRHSFPSWDQAALRAAEAHSPLDTAGA